MENKNLIEKIKTLLVTYGFLAENEPTFNSFKLVDETLVQMIGELELNAELFIINESTGEREVIPNGNYVTDTMRFEVIDGKVSVINERFVEVKTPDGIVLKIDGELSVGNTVMVVTEEGEIPAPDGNYELEDGTKFKVENGVISEIGEEETEPEVEIEPEGTPAPENEMSEIFEMLKTFIQSVTEKMNAMNEQMSETNQKLNDVTTEFNKFKKEPAGSKIPNGKIEMSNEETNSKIEKILQFRNKK